MKSSEADVAIRFGRGQWPGLTSQLLAKDTVFPVAAPHYRGGRLPQQLCDLTDCEIIIHPAISWRFWLEAAGSRVERLNGSLITDDSLLMIEAAINGQGVALVNGHLVEEDLASGRLAEALWRRGGRRLRALGRLGQQFASPRRDPSLRRLVDSRIFYARRSHGLAFRRLSDDRCGAPDDDVDLVAQRPAVWRKHRGATPAIGALRFHLQQPEVLASANRASAGIRRRAAREADEGVNRASCANSLMLMPSFSHT